MVRNVENAPFYGIFDSSFLKGTEAEFKYDSIEQAIAEGSPYVVEADTLEDLAAKMGIKDVDAFLKTIETYNSVKGTDDPDPAFGVPNNQLSFVEEGPFYGVLMVSLNAGTMGGIQTQMTGEVLDVYGEVMPGLYACGEASNGAIYRPRLHLRHLRAQLLRGRTRRRQQRRRFRPGVTASRSRQKEDRLSKGLHPERMRVTILLVT